MWAGTRQAVAAVPVAAVPVASGMGVGHVAGGTRLHLPLEQTDTHIALGVVVAEDTWVVALAVAAPMAAVAELVFVTG